MNVTKKELSKHQIRIWHFASLRKPFTPDVHHLSHDLSFHLSNSTALLPLPQTRIFHDQTIGASFPVPQPLSISLTCIRQIGTAAFRSATLHLIWQRPAGVARQLQPLGRLPALWKAIRCSKRKPKTKVQTQNMNAEVTPARDLPHSASRY